MTDQGRRMALAIDVGGSKIISAVVTASGEIIASDRNLTPASEGPVAVVEAMVASAKRAVSRAGMDAVSIDAIGVAAAGPSNPDTGIVYTSPHLPGWEYFPVRDRIEKGLERPAFLINDANAAALGELYFGAARGARDFIYITVSTGIGGGIVIGGKLYTGTGGGAGEIGHMTIDHQGPPCHCGGTGCWEALASGTALAREAVAMIRAGAVTSILELAGDDISSVTAETVHKAAVAGDGLARDLLQQTAYYFGIGLRNLINLFNPELIVIGGGLSNIGDQLLLPAFRVAGERSYQELFRQVRFARAQLGENSGVVGAAAYALGKTREGLSA